MEARATFRGQRASRTLVAGVLVVVALCLGAAGGYVAAGLSGGKVASPSQVAPRAILDQSQGGPQSDLTRAQPKAAAVQGGPQSDLTRALPTAAPAAPRFQHDDPSFVE